jgi:hypothetical protein
MDRQELIRKIEAFSQASGLKPTTVCQYALQNRRFYDNIVAGRDYQVGTAQRLTEWMDRQSAERGAA